MGQVQCVLLITITKGAGWAAFSINLRPFSSAIGARRVVRNLGLESSWGFYHSRNGSECTTRPDKLVLRLAGAASVK